MNAANAIVNDNNAEEQCSTAGVRSNTKRRQLMCAAQLQNAKQCSHSTNDDAMVPAPLIQGLGPDFCARCKSCIIIII